jgi:putative endonuclease
VSSRHARRNAWKFGHFGETIARWYLRFKGYRILASRYKTPVGEIDLIACRASVLVFIEVKARRHQGTLDQPVSPKQRQRIGRTALVFLQNHPEFADFDMRFDLVLVRSWSMPLHIQTAWRL